MRRQTLIALGIALVLGFLAVYLANVYLTRTEARADAVQSGMTKVAVAAIPLDYGTQLTPDKVKFVDYPASSLPSGTFSQWNQLVPAGKQRVVLRPITMNEPILASKLAGEGMGASIAYLLPDGMRAAAVRINDVSGVAGFVQPSDTVDVLITRNVTGGGEARQVTDVLLQNVRVIAIDQQAQGADGKPILAKTATLEVNPTDAQKLALAQQVGSLSLVLRKPGQEQDAGRLETVSMSDLRYSYYGARPVNAAASTNSVRTSAPRRIVRRPAATTRPASPPRPATSNIQVIRGTEGSNYEVGGYGS
ncbi:MAG TPA: Flp pilus assembly protein CpaB [Sphingomicrobium sp.]|nr:Flp pilus assembly protein CpaB [Sphingomicrobium sp.]